MNDIETKLNVIDYKLRIIDDRLYELNELEKTLKRNHGMDEELLFEIRDKKSNLKKERRRLLKEKDDILYPNKEKVLIMKK